LLASSGLSQQQIRVNLFLSSTRRADEALLIEQVSSQSVHLFDALVALYSSAGIGYML
jgi:hypothetical protein